MLSATMTDTKDVVRAFYRLPQAMASRVERKCLEPAAKLIGDAIRELSPKGKAPDSPLFSRSVGVRMRTYRNHGYVLAIVGHRRGQEWRGRRPTNIAWLLEHGHRIAVGGTLPRTNRSAEYSKRTRKMGLGSHGGNVRGFGMVEEAFSRTLSAARNIIDSRFPQLVEEAVREVSNA